ncbi:hypothetical protein MMC16_000270 [Acarospora aff. strigata]|nr:hypothetical protein [Acarospora aff. strigata]
MGVDVGVGVGVKKIMLWDMNVLAQPAYLEPEFVVSMLLIARGPGEDEKSPSSPSSSEEEGKREAGEEE